MSWSLWTLVTPSQPLNPPARTELPRLCSIDLKLCSVRDDRIEPQGSHVTDCGLTTTPCMCLARPTRPNEKASRASATGLRARTSTNSSASRGRDAIAKVRVQGSRGSEDMIDDDLGDVHAQTPSRADAGVVGLVSGTEGAIPSQGPVQVDAPRIELLRAREEHGVAVRHRDDVLIQQPRLEGEVATGEGDLGDLLQHAGGRGDGRVQAARLPDVGVGVLGEGGLHLVGRLVLTKVDGFFGSFRRDLHLQERCNRLDCRRCAADACEADDVHDFVAQLHDGAALPPARQRIVHVDEGLLQIQLLDDAHSVDAQLLDLADEEVEREALHQAGQDEGSRVGPPAGQCVGIGVAEPLPEHHVHDALRNIPLQERTVVQLVELGVLPIVGHQALELRDALAVGITLRIQEHVVKRIADGRPVRVRTVVGQEDEDVRGEEVGDARRHATEGGLPHLLRLQDAVAVLVRPHPDALAVPPVGGVSEGRALPHEERQSALSVGNQRHEGTDHIAPPCPGHVARVASHHRAHCRAELLGAGDATSADGDADEDARAKACEDALDQIEGQGQPHAGNRQPGGILGHVDEGRIDDILDGAPLRRVDAFHGRLRLCHGHGWIGGGGVCCVCVSRCPAEVD
eukprot:CAMPEP_0203858324 /NCGR_PEP_ID=MMETSP0359-20131031/11212_1 /ASSEMBLY_ACC=CAM_ASM_000338 /TAXON_ID=268821 /ORGANISM="Scrippsiella Hangoei, Strain SHTV-5" /LENGTH=627 /DNA_ID=CAMNT_0050775089 /DNA_START=375 /DNA_END=2255 /DNA_ORIENTATION=-